jgi:osmoprotectant transport system permease protein
MSLLRRTAWQGWGPFGACALLLVLLTWAMPLLRPLFACLFPELERPLYLQDPFSELLLAHLWLVGVSSLAALVPAFVLGAWVTRPGGSGFRPIVEVLLAMGQTVPPVAVLALAVPLLGFGERPALIALLLYALLPMLHGVIAGLESTPPAVLDAARGLGLSRRQIFLQVELRLAAPVLLAGLRSAVTINIGTAAIAATVGAKNLGSPIIVGLSGFNTAYVLQGALLTGLLAVTVDAAFDAVLLRLQAWKPVALA